MSAALVRDRPPCYPPYPPTPLVSPPLPSCSSGTSNIITAMKESGISRVAVVTSIGAGDSEKQAPFFFKVWLGK